MTDQSDYAPRPHRTPEEIDAMVAFIEARVEPLRVAAEYDSDERKPLDALLDLVAYTKARAQWAAENGGIPDVAGLALVTWKWRDHPDFQASWRDI